MKYGWLRQVLGKRNIMRDEKERERSGARSAVREAETLEVRWSDCSKAGRRMK